MRSFLAYPGGKGKMADRIVAAMSTHRVYVEPFGGTASVLFAKPRSTFELVNDIDGDLVTLLRVVRDRGDELAAKVAFTPYGREEYDLADPHADLDELERARRVCVRIGQSFAACGLVNPGKGWRLSFTRHKALATTWAEMPDRILAACGRLQGVHLERADALAVIARHGAETDGLIYVDPPYLGSTRTGRMYQHEMEDAEQHERLAAALGECQAHVLLSGYHAPLYDQLYAGWHRTEWAAVANNNGSSDTDPRRVEVLWSNRPLPDQTTIFEQLEAADAAV